jgi:sarcosine oxidase
MKYDVAVVGLGAMGSATAYALAARGVRTIGFDQFDPPHSRGSSHGHSRIIREAYYEHPLYVPLVKRSYELWRELETRSGAELLRETGGVWVGPRTGPLVRGALQSAETHDIDFELLDAAELTRRFPAYRPEPRWVGVYERRAGMLFPERCVSTFLAQAQALGAALRLNTSVAGWTVDAAGVTLTTSRGEERAERIVVSAGAWLPELARHLDAKIPVQIERQMSHWFDPADAADGRYDAANCPVGLWEIADEELFLTMPNEGHGVKCGMHHSGATTTAASVNRVVSDAENAAATRLLEHVMPGAAQRFRDARVCLYTNTPDHHFIIDQLAGGRVLLLSPCSGHGFKFASAIGEVAADLLSVGRSRLDVSPFSLARFG